MFRSDIQKTNTELNTNRRELSLNKELGVVTGLLATGSSDQQMLSLAWFLQSVYSNSETLLADIHKYGSPKKAIEEIRKSG
jgi:hypothetical protein